MTYSKFKIERIKQNKTQEDVAAIANISRTTISCIENGRIDAIQFGTLKKLAAALNSTVEELFLSQEE